MTGRIRWGILATGAIATSFVEDLRLVPDAEVVAVGSRTIEAARAFAARHDIPRAHGSWQALAEDPQVDVVYVATPHSAHHAAALTCLKAGKPVLNEKAFTLDLASSEDLVETAAKGRLFLMEAMWTKCFPAVRRLGELLAEGAIGTVTEFHADFGVPGPFPPSSRMCDPALGGGALLDLGVYPLTVAELVMGPPTAITARARLTPDGVDEQTAVILESASGAYALISCSMRGESPCRATVVGTGGTLELPRDFFHPASLILQRAGRDPEQFDYPHQGWGYHYEAAEVHRCLRAGLTESPLVPLSGTLAVMATMDAIREQIGVHYPPYKPGERQVRTPSP